MGRAIFGRPGGAGLDRAFGRIYFRASDEYGIELRSMDSRGRLSQIFILITAG